MAIITALQLKCSSQHNSNASNATERALEAQELEKAEALAEVASLSSESSMRLIAFSPGPGARRKFRKLLSQSVTAFEPPPAELAMTIFDVPNLNFAFVFAAAFSGMSRSF
jgi:hypothetical protein